MAVRNMACCQMGYGYEGETYLSDMILQHPRDGHGVFGVLSSYHGEVVDLESVIGGEIL